MHIYFDPCCYSSDLPGVNPATKDRMILYYRLMTKVFREKLAPQARQVFRDSDKVARGLPRSPGLWIRSPDPLAGRWGF
jgi:hypothetical protein